MDTTTRDPQFLLVVAERPGSVPHHKASDKAPRSQVRREGERSLENAVARNSCTPAVLVCVEIVGREPGTGRLLRAGLLTPYLLQTIARDVVHAQRGARLEVSVPWSTSGADLALVLDQFAFLSARGVPVSGCREPPASADPT